MRRGHPYVMPRRMQVEFSAVVQARAAGRIGYVAHHLFEVAGAVQGIELQLQAGGQRLRLLGNGNGPIAATVDALGLALRIDAYEERALGRGADASALAIVEAAKADTAGTRFGVGIHPNIITASVLAVLSAAARLGVTVADLRGEPLDPARSA